MHQKFTIQPMSINLTSYLGSLTFHMVQTIFFSEYPYSVEEFAAIFTKIGANLYIFSTLYNLNIYL